MSTIKNDEWWNQKVHLSNLTLSRRAIMNFLVGPGVVSEEENKKQFTIKKIKEKLEKITKKKVKLDEQFHHPYNIPRFKGDQSLEFGFDNEKWSQEDLENLMHVLEKGVKILYELKQKNRGTYVIRGPLLRDLREELSDYVSDLRKQIKLVDEHLPENQLEDNENK